MGKSNTIKLTTSKSFEESFDTFQAFNKAKNLSKGTIYNYDISKKSIMAFMGGDFNLSDFSADTLNDYIAYCRDRGNNEISINTRLVNLRTMLNFFSEREYMPKVKVKLLKTTKTVKETYTDTELKILLKKPNIKKAGFDDYRNWVIINYLLATGNRLSSILNIKMGDLNLDEDEVILRHTKNRTQQIVPIAGALKGILIEYLRYRKPKTDNDYLFCTWHGEQLSHFGLINAIKRYNQRRGITKTSIHLFRHTFAKMWIMNGGDILRLQKLLGHKSL
jgi:integrase/recombinase XerD